MSFDLYLWHESEPISADVARSMLERWNDGERGVFQAHPAVPALRAALLDRFPALEDLDPADVDDRGVWSMTPTSDDAILAVSCVWSRADEVGRAVLELAAAHGLVCYEPGHHVLNPNAAGHVPAFTLTAAGQPDVPDPDDERLDRTVRRLSPVDFHAVLDRADGWWAQVGHGPSAGVAPGTYALEFREGAQGAHLHTSTTDVAEAVRFLQDFLGGRDDWRQRHRWQQW
ncbi:hypothetical protein AB0B66_31045 [Catellatospora sp. NPDC049111]|uniref:hypothetical protein n=1 Tax=Catellatospora sp. NPDC049111 TaxID=3155271 RepID=UPI00340BA0A7